MSRPLRLGRVILARYKVIDIIGCGGEGDVYKAVDLKTRDIVAIKQLSACPGDSYYE